jgi:hypothetical protein
MLWTVVIIAAVCAVTAVVVSYLVDRDSAKRRAKTLAEPVQRPGLESSPAPTYLTAEQAKAHHQPQDRALSDDQRELVDAALVQVAPILAGWPSADFVTDPVSGRAVLERPTVLVAEAVNRVADLAPLIRAVLDDDRSLVVVARKIDPAVLATLLLNASTGRLKCLGVVTDKLDGIARQAGAAVLAAADVTAGYLPDPALGHCDWWVADSQHSWIVPHHETT